MGLELHAMLFEKTSRQNVCIAEKAIEGIAPVGVCFLYVLGRTIIRMELMPVGSRYLKRGSLSRSADLLMQSSTQVI